LSLLGIAGLLLFSVHWSFPVILAAAAVPGVLIRLRFAEQMYRWQRQLTSTERRVRYFDWMLTLYYYAKEVWLFNLGSLFMLRARSRFSGPFKRSLYLSVSVSGTLQEAETS